MALSKYLLRSAVDSFVFRANDRFVLASTMMLYSALVASLQYNARVHVEELMIDSSNTTNTTRKVTMRKFMLFYF